MALNISFPTRLGYFKIIEDIALPCNYPSLSPGKIPLEALKKSGLKNNRLLLQNNLSALFHLLIDTQMYKHAHINF